MKDADKTKEQLLNELNKLHQRIVELETIKSDRKRAEETLRAEENLLQTIIETEPECVKLMASDGTLLMMNRAGLDMLEAESFEQVKGKCVYPLVSPEYLEAFKSLVRDVFQGKTRELQFEMVGIKGKRLWLETHSVPLRNEKGETVAILGITRDITERKKTEKALRESEKRYKRLVESVTDYIYTVQVENGRPVGTIHGLGCVAVTGYTSEEYDADPYLWYKIIHEEDRKMVTEHADRILSGKASSIVHRLIHKDGSIRWVTNAVVPRFDEQHKLVAYDGLIKDISERKLAEEAVKDGAEQFRAITTTATDAVILMDNQGKIEYWNPAAARIFGYSNEETMGKELHLFLAPERYHKAYREGFSRFAKTGEGLAVGNTLEFMAVTKEGIEFPIEVSVSAFQRKGQWYAVGIVRDITERKRVEEEIKFLASIVQSTPDAVCSINLGGNMFSWNKGAEKIFGYKAEEIVGKPITTIIPKEIAQQELEHCFNILNKEGFFSGYETIRITKDGRRIPVKMTAVALKDKEQNITSYASIMTDISEHKKLEEQLIHAQKMETVGTLAGGVAHDFNNILTAIIGFGSILQMKMKEDDPLRHNVEHILTSAERAANLTRGLLAFSRKQIINPIPVSLNELVSKAGKLLTSLLAEDIELKEILTEKELIVLGDRTYIEQVLVNLCTNARDAMPDGGLLTIKTELAEMDEKYINAHGYGKTGRYALISVTDTGMGIDEKTKEKIFEPFFTTKEVGKGTGLGLSTVYGIIKQHNGYINCYSEVGKGTTFKIYLPLTESKVKETKLSEDVNLIGGTETVLIADDNEEVRRFIKAVLDKFGYKVIAAIDGEDAVRKFVENTDEIQLLLLDVVMPKKNGKKVYEEIKLIRPDIKALFISGYTANVIHKKGVIEKGLNFISKPILPKELLKKVRQALDA